MDNAGNKVNIIILDACRNNPFESKFHLNQQGLTGIYGPMGSYIAFATEPGKMSEDGDGRNGLYTQYLLKYMQYNDLTIEQVLKKVRIAVSEKTNGKQIPWENSSLMGNFYFSIDDIYEQNKSHIDGIGYLSQENDLPARHDLSHWEQLLTFIPTNKLFMVSILGAFLLVTVLIIYKLKAARINSLKVATVIPSASHQKTISSEKTQHLKIIEHKVPYNPSIKRQQGNLKSVNVDVILTEIYSGQEVIIGREKKCEVVISSYDISRYHTKIGWDETHHSFWIEDLNSSNGTWIVTKTGDNKRIPSNKRFYLETVQKFYLVETESEYAFYIEPVQQEQHINDDTVLVGQMFDQNAIINALNYDNGEKCLLLFHGKILASIKSSNKIIVGRGEEADVIVKKQEISRQHVLLKWDEESQRCLIKDMNSSNGTWFADSHRLTANEFKPVQDGQSFFLSDKTNTFTICYLLK